jgi:peptide methionine sulfoxide reductase MsrB
MSEKVRVNVKVREGKSHLTHAFSKQVTSHLAATHQCHCFFATQIAAGLSSEKGSPL